MGKTLLPVTNDFVFAFFFVSNSILDEEMRCIFVVYFRMFRIFFKIVFCRTRIALQLRHLDMSSVFLQGIQKKVHALGL